MRSYRLPLAAGQSQVGLQSRKPTHYREAMRSTGFLCGLRHMSDMKDDSNQGCSFFPQELRCCGAAITRLALSTDDATLFAGAADGSTFVMDVRDRGPARAALGYGIDVILVQNSVCQNLHLWRQPQTLLRGGRER